MILHKVQDKENEAQEGKATQLALREKVQELKMEKKEMIKLLTQSQVG